MTEAQRMIDKQLNVIRNQMQGIQQLIEKRKAEIKSETEILDQLSSRETHLYLDLTKLRE